MTTDINVGRWLAAVAFAAIGFGAIVSGHLPVGLIPLKTLLSPILAGLLGTAFGSLVLAAGVTERFPRAALLAAAFPALAVLVIHLPRLVTEYRDPLLWSSLLQMLAVIAGVLLLGETDEPNLRNLHNLRTPLRNLRNLRTLWCAALIGFGVQHFMYPAFIAGLIPEWMPARLPLAWITGIAFEMAALSFLLGRYELLAGRLLALMWISWVFILHIPRIAAQPGLEAGWTSGFIALGLGGVALNLASRALELPAAFRPVGTARSAAA
jgi:uncharacterized membrane protein